MTLCQPDPLASERLLRKALAKGRPLRRRRTIVRRAAVLGFVAAVAAGGAAGAAVAAGGHAAPAPATGRSVPVSRQRAGHREVLPSRVTASASEHGHPAAGAADNDTATFWGVGARDGDLPGVGQSLTLDFAEPQPLAGIAFLSGDQGSAIDFAATYRPKDVELIFSAGAPRRYHLQPTMRLQSLTFSPRRTASVEILVLSVYPPSTGTVAGTLHRMCALTDVFVYVQAPDKRST